MEHIVSRREYFIYKGVMYGIGTKVLLSDIGCKKHYIPQKHKDKLYAFEFGQSDDRYIFHWKDERGWEYGSNSATIHNLEEDIKEIVKPVYVQLVPWQKKAWDNMVNGTVSPDIFGGCLIYTIIMIIGAIFVARFTIWVFTTVIFIVWLLNQYRV